MGNHLSGGALPCGCCAACYQRALRLKPGDADSLGLRGLAYFKLGRYDKTIADCDQVLSQYPQYPFGLYLRGLAKRMSNEIAGGNADIDAAMALRPQ